MNPKYQNEKGPRKANQAICAFCYRARWENARNKASDVIGYQLLKSGTSIGANYREAVRAQSRDDFIHKIGICEKEASETEYWLELAQEARLVALASARQAQREAGELLAIFVAGGRTAKSRR